MMVNNNFSGWLSLSEDIKIQILSDTLVSFANQDTVIKNIQKKGSGYCGQKLFLQEKSVSKMRNHLVEIIGDQLRKRKEYTIERFESFLDGFMIFLKIIMFLLFQKEKNTICKELLRVLVLPGSW